MYICGFSSPCIHTGIINSCQLVDRHSNACKAYSRSISCTKDFSRICLIFNINFNFTRIQYMIFCSDCSIRCCCFQFDNIASVLQRQYPGSGSTGLHCNSITFYNKIFRSLCRCFQGKRYSFSTCIVKSIIRAENNIIPILFVIILLDDIICYGNVFVSAYTVNHVSSVHRVHCIKVFSGCMVKSIICYLNNCYTILYCCNNGMSVY